MNVVYSEDFIKEAKKRWLQEEGIGDPTGKRFGEASFMRPAKPAMRVVRVGGLHYFAPAEGDAARRAGGDGRRAGALHAVRARATARRARRRAGAAARAERLAPGGAAGLGTGGAGQGGTEYFRKEHLNPGICYSTWRSGI